MKRILLSHSKSLGGRKTLVVGPIDEELLGKEAATKILERTKFEQVRVKK